MSFFVATFTSAALAVLAPPATAATLGASNVIGFPGQKSRLSAELSVDGRPAAGAWVSFKVAGTPAGRAQTGAEGAASVEFTIPDTFVQKIYPLEVSATPARGAAVLRASAKLAVFRAATELVLGDLSWGAYKDEAGSPIGCYTLSLRRAHDRCPLHLPVKVVVNGAFFSDVDGLSALVPLPSAARTWKVDVSFAGNASYLPSVATKTYCRP